MAYNNNDVVEIPIEIDISEAEAQLEQITNAIRELNSNTDDTEEQVKALEKQYDILAEYVTQAKEALEENSDAVNANANAQGNLSSTVNTTNESFAKQAKELNDTKDVTDFAGQAVSSLGLEETALGKTINTTTGFIGKSIGFIKNGSKALDAMKKSANGAGKEVNFLGKAFNFLKTNWIIVAFVAIAAAIAKVASGFRELEANIRKSSLNKMDLLLQNINDKYDNQIKLMGLLGKNQSEITQKQIDQLDEVNRRIKLNQDSMKSMWKELDYGETKGFSLSKVIDKYLKGDVTLYEQLGDKAKELVDKYAEQAKQLDKNEKYLKGELELQKQINLITEEGIEAQRVLDKELYNTGNKYDKQIQKLNNQLDKQTAINELEEEKNGYATNYLENLQKQFDIENRISDLELARSNEEIEAYDKKLKSIEKQIVDAEKLGLVEQKEKLLAEKRNVLEQKRNIEINKSIILTQKSLRQTQMEAEVYRSMIDNVKTFNDLFLQSRERLLGFMDANSFDKVSLTEYLNEYKKLFDNINTIYDEFKLNTTDLFNKLKKLYEIDTDNIYYAYVKASEAIQEVNSGIDKDGKELTKERKAELIDFISSANNAMQEYFQINDNISNKLEDRALKMMSTIKDKFEGLFGNKEFSRELLNSFEKPLIYFRNELESTIKYYEVLQKPISLPVEEYDEFNDHIKYVNEEILQYLKDGKKIALKTISSLLDSIDKEIADFNITRKESELNYWQGVVDDMYKYQSVLGGQLWQFEAMEEKIAWQTKEYKLTLLSQESEAMRKAGFSEIEIEQHIADEKKIIENNYLKDKLLLNQKYKQEYLNIASDLTGNLQTISENAFQLNDEMSKEDFERHKKIQGATLIASTYSQAAQAFGSTFAQAPGGVASKTIQAGIASAAVMASGIAAYNRLMETTQNSTMDASSTNNISASTTAVETGTSSVARTLVGGRYETYAREGGTQTVLVVDEVEYKMLQQQNIRKVSVI